MSTQQVILELETKRDSNVIAFITSDRPPPVAAKIAGDVIRIFYEHLTSLEEKANLDLFIHSRGGDTAVPWRLVNLLREFCSNLTVLVPYRAHSAATLIALGANKIIMSRLGELSPIDPTVGTPFNPSHPTNPQQQVEIGVEDVIGFFNFTRERIGITDQGKVLRVLEKFVDNLHPLAIGGIYRSHSFIRMIATELLSLHMTGKGEEVKIPHIVEHMVEKLYYHNYSIPWKEAKKIGLKVVKADDETEKLLMNLHFEYEKEMSLGKPFNPEEFLAGGNTGEKVVSLAVVESKGKKSKVLKKIKVTRNAIPPGAPPGAIPPYSVHQEFLGWQTVEPEGSTS